MPIFADLHIHSFYSDGTMSPREIADAAALADVGLVAVADHNVLEGSRELKTCCEETRIGFIPAVELDSLDNGAPYHILGYGIDLENTGFTEFVKKNRLLLDQRSVILIEKMEGDFPCLSVEDYHRFSYDRRLGGWKALHYFQARGLTERLKQGIGFYETYRVPFTIVDFPPVSTASRAIRNAGGRAVLAHPGEMIDTSDVAAFRRMLERLVGLGLDGIECYYPTHSEEVTHACVELCRAEGLLITCGSDCHGGFGKTSVGHMKVPVEELNLDGLVRAQS